MKQQRKYISFSIFPPEVFLARLGFKRGKDDRPLCLGLTGQWMPSGAMQAREVPGKQPGAVPDF